MSEMLILANKFKVGDTGFKIENWIVWQAVRLPSIFFLNYNIKTFTDGFSNLGYFSFIIVLLLLITLIIRKSKLQLPDSIFLLLLIVCIFISNKGVGILKENIILSIFGNNILLSSLRSYDKSLIFLPFFMLVILFLNIEQITLKCRRLILLFLTLSLLSVFPFITGGIQTRYSIAFNKGESYLSAKYSYLKKVPNEYFKAANAINNKLYNSKILRMPYNVINSVGWVNFPKWKLIGSDPTVQLFNIPTVQMNSFSAFGVWNYGKYWNKQSKIASLWILPFAGLLNAKYIMYHKDVDPQFILQAKDKIQFYEDNMYLNKIYSNDYFDTYQLNKKYLLPYFYTPNSLIFSSQKLGTLPGILNQDDYKIKSAIYFENSMKAEKESSTSALFNPELIKKTEIKNTPILEFKKIDPTKYRVVVHRAKGEFPMVFSESFHEGWKTYLAAPDNLKFNTNNQISKYKILDGNGEDQANREELKSYIARGLISSLGNGKEKEIKHMKWENDREKLDYVEKYNIDFVSKNFQDTIQNDNLPSGSIFETWFKKPIEENKNHKMVNGYANSWMINTEKICRIGCKKNSDGTYDFEMVVEFWPQRLFYIGLAISSTTLLGCLSYLLYSWIKKRNLPSNNV
ncbi:MAG: hypothetical protein WCL18_07475 [bacterium]